MRNQPMPNHAHAPRIAFRRFQIIPILLMLASFALFAERSEAKTDKCPPKSQNKKCSETQPDPTPSPPSTKLSWAPPVLTNPITITVPDNQWLVKMDQTRDYILKLGHHRACAPKGDNRSGLWIEGGRNVVVIGGRVSVPCYSTSYGRGAVKVRFATGIVHLEGLLIDGAYLSDGILISAPQATVQIQNVRIENVHGTEGDHSDLIQIQGSVNHLRVDRLTGSTDYQGIFLYNDPGTKVGSVDLRNVNTHAFANAHHSALSKWSYGFPVSVRNFWSAKGLSKYALAGRFYPQPRGSNMSPTPADCYSIVAADGRSLTWTSPCGISGTAYDGIPPDGDFVPAGVPGTGYSSPGY